LVEVADDVSILFDPLALHLVGGAQQYLLSARKKASKLINGWCKWSADVEEFGVGNSGLIRENSFGVSQGEDFFEI